MINIKHILAFFKRLKTRTLFIVSICSGLICFILMPVVAPNLQEPLNGILFSLGFICWGTSGIPMLTRQEADFGLIVLEGPLAIILGIIMILVSFALSLIPIIVRILN
jgi:hypothetical protein